MPRTYQSIIEQLEQVEIYAFPIAFGSREQFLQEKINHEAATIAKLINLPHQHALLVLPVCVQKNLRYLQRSLKSDDLVHLGDKLDTTLREAVARIR
ncbi:hypothetical protein EHS25_004755 [Saitozyma podzolica]|uniref:Uncharacterized protein n=1 Tax=Saitozyma podzolica TaxID=1890683 RepID=A0A427Y2R4_9TREE|nr:hypothetical protein EHS25_004755 [Saitozyma podzolica]